MSEIRILATAAGKGGTGKSTVAFAVADLLSTTRPDLDVALLDLDPQASLTQMAGQKAVKDPLAAAPVPLFGFQFYRGGRSLGRHTTDEITAHLDAILGAASNRLIVADLTPALDSPTHSAVVNHPATFILGVMSTEPASLRPMQEVVALAQRVGRPHSVLLNKHDSRVGAEKATIRVARDIFDSEVLVADVVHNEALVKDSYNESLPATRMKRATKSRFVQTLRGVLVELFGESATETTE